MSLHQAKSGRLPSNWKEEKKIHRTGLFRRKGREERLNARAIEGKVVNAMLALGFYIYLDAVATFTLSHVPPQTVSS